MLIPSCYLSGNKETGWQVIKNASPVTNAKATAKDALDAAKKSFDLEPKFFYNGAKFVAITRLTDSGTTLKLTNKQIALASTLVDARQAHEVLKARSFQLTSMNTTLVNALDNAFVQLSQTQRVFDAECGKLGDGGSALLAEVERQTTAKRSKLGSVNVDGLQDGVALTVVTRKAATQFINWQFDGLSIDDAHTAAASMRAGMALVEATAGMQHTFIATMSDGTSQIQVDGPRSVTALEIAIQPESPVIDDSPQMSNG